MKAIAAVQPCSYRAVSSSSTDLTLVSCTYHGAEERRVDGAEVRHVDRGERRRENRMNEVSDDDAVVGVQDGNDSEA